MGFLSGTVRAWRAQGDDDGRRVVRALKGSGRRVVSRCGGQERRRDDRKLVISRPQDGRATLGDAFEWAALRVAA